MARKSGTENTETLRYYLVGVEGVGKAKLARAMKDKYGFDVVKGIKAAPAGVALGVLADYRVELQLLANRLPETQLVGKSVYTHSVIDSLAYIAVRYIGYRDFYGGDDEALQKWSSLALLAGECIKDSFRYDSVFFIKSDNPEDELMQDALESVLVSFDIKFTVLSGNFEDNLKTIGDEISGSGSASPEPIQS